MLPRHENELLTRVGPGTPMGETIRRYWVPACLSTEIAEPDCPPVRVRLLGEYLVAFRDTHGRIGLVDEYCPHRRVSLFFGRNEECGLRCVYHGWKFDVEGNCLDQLNEPPEHQFKTHIHLTAYPTCEYGGIVWAYLGPADKIPAHPRFAWTQAPASHRHVTKVIQECNWLQALEGGLDTSHAPIMHRLLKDDARRGGVKPSNPYVQAGAPSIVLDLTDYGYQYTGIRRLGEDRIHARTYHFIMPFHQIRYSTSERGLPTDAGHIWVPIDDETCMVYNWCFSKTEALDATDRLEKGLGNGPVHVDQATFRSKARLENNYFIDRQVQKTESYTGIDGVNVQDRAIQESMGKIVNRLPEHLGPADKAIAHMRRLLLRAVKTVQEGGTPPGIAPTYYALTTHLDVLPKDADWRAAVAPEISGKRILQTV